MSDAKPLNLAHLLFLQSLSSANSGGVHPPWEASSTTAAMCSHLVELGLAQAHHSEFSFGGGRPRFKRTRQGDAYVREVFHWALVRGVCVEGLPSRPEPEAPLFPPSDPLGGGR